MSLLSWRCSLLKDGFRRSDAHIETKSLLDAIATPPPPPGPEVAEPKGLCIRGMDIDTIIDAQKAARINEKRLDKLRADVAKRQQDYTHALVSRGRAPVVHRASRSSRANLSV